jgi:hypothetical protein
MATTSLTVQFLGRFAYLHSKQKKGKDGKDRYAFNVIANDLAFNNTLGMGAHEVRVMIRRSLLTNQSRGVEHANAVFATTNAGGDPDEWVVWNVGGNDVSFHGGLGSGGAIFAETVPATDLLTPGKKIDPAVLHRTPMKAVNARFAIADGVVETRQMTPGEKFELRAYKDLFKPTGNSRIMADVAEWNVTGSRFICVGSPTARRGSFISRAKVHSK